MWCFSAAYHLLYLLNYSPQFVFFQTSSKQFFCCENVITTCRGDTYYSIMASSRKRRYAKPLSLLFLTPWLALSSHQLRTLVCLFWSGDLQLCSLTSEFHYCLERVLWVAGCIKQIVWPLNQWSVGYFQVCFFWKSSNRNQQQWKGFEQIGDTTLQVGPQLYITLL